MANLASTLISDSMDKLDSNLSFISYNMHGFNQGKNLLGSLCDQLSDCIFVQEHWLTPNNLCQLRDFSDEYNFYGISAMEHAISSGVLRGRSYGGAGVLLRKQFCNVIKYECCKERYAIIVVGKIILVSIYLPSVKNSTELNIISDVISSIELILHKFPFHYVIVGADLNSDLSSHNESSLILNKFMNDFDLCRCDETCKKSTV